MPAWQVSSARRRYTDIGRYIGAAPMRRYPGEEDIRRGADTPISRRRGAVVTLKQVPGNNARLALLESRPMLLLNSVPTSGPGQVKICCLMPHPGILSLGTRSCSVKLPSTVQGEDFFVETYSQHIQLEPVPPLRL